MAQSLAGVLTRPEARAALDWQPFHDGVEVCWIYRIDDAADGSGSPGAAFLRYAPGASVPVHEHPGFEHIMVLEGSQRDDNGLHETGAVVVNPPGSRHAVTSDDGCIVLAIWQAPVRFL